MKKKSALILLPLIILGLFVTACDVAQASEPTSSPMITNTSIPSNTTSPTFTLAPTNTLPPIQTPTENGAIEVVFINDCQTIRAILELEGTTVAPITIDAGTSETISLMPGEYKESVKYEEVITTPGNVPQTVYEIFLQLSETNQFVTSITVNKENDAFSVGFSINEFECW